MKDEHGLKNVRDQSNIKKMKICVMKNDFVKWNDREDVSPFLSVF